MSRSSDTGRHAVRYIDDELVVSDTQVWTYVLLPTAPYEFVDYEDRKDLASKLFLSLASLVSRDAVEVHLLSTSRPHDTTRWARDLHQRVSGQTPGVPGWDPNPGWLGFLNRMAAYVQTQQFVRKEVYLGVCLGDRGGAAGLNLAGPVKRLTRVLERAAGVEDALVSEKELAAFREKAREVRRSLESSHVRAQPADASTVAWLIRRHMFSGLDAPEQHISGPGQTWGPGEIVPLLDGIVENGRKSLRIEQTDDDLQTTASHVATLCLSRFPEALEFPDQPPWMHFAASLSFPVDFSSRITLMPADLVRKDVASKLKGVKDQTQHIASTGESVPLQLQEEYERATALEYVLSKERLPWAYGRHRILVAAEDAVELATRCRRVIEHYRELAIDVTWPTGDQLDLFLEALPGDRVRAHAYFQRQELLTVAGALPTAGAEVGDQRDISTGGGFIGPYLGQTTYRVRNPVFYSPFLAPARDNPPGVAITGAPGGGKSYLAFTLAYLSALSGAWTIYLDPKADAIDIVRLPGLGRPQLFDLRDGHDGMLDPWALADDPSSAPLLAVETLRLLLGGRLDAKREELLMIAVNQVTQGTEPSLFKVVDVLLAATDDEGGSNARSMGMYLQTVARMPFARLAFAPRRSDPIRPQDGLTVITLLGLELPSSEADVQDYSFENRLAVTVMYLLTRFARELMLSMDKDHPKALFIDEAWAVTQTPQGAKLVPEITRMGRSHNTVAVLVSQNAGDLGAKAVENSIGTRFAFKSTTGPEIKAILDSLGLEDTPEYRDTVRELRKGECLMKDIDGRIARVHIDPWAQDLFNAFNTNPETRAAAREAARQAEAARTAAVTAGPA